MHSILKLTLSSSVALLLTACASAPATPALETQLQVQLSEIDTLSQQLRNTADPGKRRQLLEQRQRSLQLGVQLIVQAQKEKREAHAACLRQQEHLPTDTHSCVATESPEDTQLRMLGVLMQSAWADGQPHPENTNLRTPL